VVFASSDLPITEFASLKFTIFGLRLFADCVERMFRLILLFHCITLDSVFILPRHYSVCI